jgi:hypothetical protein
MAHPIPPKPSKMPISVAISITRTILVTIVSSKDIVRIEE